MGIRIVAQDNREIFEMSEPPAIDFVIPGMPTRTVGSVVSPGGVGKSFLALEIALQVATGVDLIGWGKFPVGRAVYLDCENSQIEIKRRLFHMFKLISDKNIIQENFFLHYVKDFNLLTTEAIHKLISLTAGARLLVLDTFRRLHMESEIDDAKMAAILSRLEDVAEETGTSILFLHHVNKASVQNGQGDLQQAARGSSVLTDNVRYQLNLTLMTKKEVKNKKDVNEKDRLGHVNLTFAKTNSTYQLDPFSMRRIDNGVLRATSKSSTAEPRGRL